MIWKETLFTLTYKVTQALDTNDPDQCFTNFIQTVVRIGNKNTENVVQDPWDQSSDAANCPNYQSVMGVTPVWST